MAASQQMALSFTAGDPTEAAALAYHAEHPEVFELFERFALQIAAAGRRHYGAKSVFERIRWHAAISGGEDFKLNNNFTALYARWFHEQHPELAGFFRTRRRG